MLAAGPQRSAKADKNIYPFGAPIGTARLVLDGQGKVIGKLAGRPAQDAALESSVHGLQGALLTSSALAFIASGVAPVAFANSGRPGRRKALAIEVTD